MPELDEKKRIIAYDTVNDPDENYYALIDNGTAGTGKVSIKELGPADMISDQYSDSSTYKVGDLCIHNNKLYVCTVAINTPHAFNLSEWELDTLGNYASQIKQSLSDLGGNGYTAPPAGSYGTNVSYVDGGYCKIGKLVIVNMRVAASQTIPVSGVLVSNLPIPAATNNIVSVTNNRKADITLGSAGQIGNADQLAQGNIILSCAYITN